MVKPIGSKLKQTQAHWSCSRARTDPPAAKVGRKLKSWKPPKPWQGLEAKYTGSGWCVCYCYPTFYVLPCDNNLKLHLIEDQLTWFLFWKTLLQKERRWHLANLLEEQSRLKNVVVTKSFTTEHARFGSNKLPASWLQIYQIYFSLITLASWLQICIWNIF